MSLFSSLPRKAGQVSSDSRLPSDPSVDDEREEGEETMIGDGGQGVKT